MLEVRSEDNPDGNSSEAGESQTRGISVYVRFTEDPPSGLRSETDEYPPGVPIAGHMGVPKIGKQSRPRFRAKVLTLVSVTSGHEPEFLQGLGALKNSK